MAKKNNINAHRRPMTKIEREAMDTMMQEFKDKLPSNGHSHYKVSGNDLQRTILYAIAGITMHRKDVKQTYQMWIDDTSNPDDWWALSVTLVSFRKVWKRAEELLKDRLEEIDNAQWYLINFKNSYEGDQEYYINADSDQEARSEVRSIWLWGNKLKSLYRATWDNVRREFQKGERVSLAGVM